MLLKPTESKGEKYLGGAVNAELPTVQEQHVPATSQSASSAVFASLWF